MKSRIPAFGTWAALLTVAAGALALSCNNQTFGGDNDAGAGQPPDMAYNGPYTDFPAAPILDPATGGNMQVPANAAALFGAADSGAQTGGPCLTDPEVGALFPRNWLRLRVHFTAPAPQNLFEIRLHAANQTNDLVVYTSSNDWKMPADLWASLTAHTVDQPITITVRGAQITGGNIVGMPSRGTSGDITIAPVAAAGSIVYWTTTSGTVLRGFKIGEETVRDVLKPAQAGATVKCVGCHSSTPDGNYVAFSRTDDAGNGDPAQIGFRSVDGLLTEPPFLTAAGRTLLARQQQEYPTFSAAHWGTGDHVALVMSHLGTAPYEISWIDLEATATTQGVGWDILKRTGDAKGAAAAVFSHSGQNIVYVSGNNPSSGVTLGSGDGDIYTVPYNNRQGGQAAPVAGASDPNKNEYYPAYSPDDKLIAFSSVPKGQTSYNNSQAEVSVVPATGGTATRLAANDPPACTGKSSPGVINSWPKWAPETLSYGGKQYYWISFSSARVGANPQLYVGGVVVENGVVKTYKAIYLWNQPPTDGNHTAAWDVFKLIIG